MKKVTARNNKEAHDDMAELARRFSTVQIPTDAERDRFLKICQTAGERVATREGFNGIGLLTEKSLHAVLKDFYEPNPAHQEIVVGTQVADICINNHIIEIQSHSLSGMHGKIKQYLSAGYTITIVLPLLAEKKLVWIDPVSKEATAPRKSPRSATIYDTTRELMRLRPFLTDPRVSVEFCFISVLEYRLRDGWSHDGKRGSQRLELMPADLHQIVSFTTKEDYGVLIPSDLKEPFTSADFALAAGISRPVGSSCLTLLNQLTLVKRIGKLGRAYLYSLPIEPPRTTSQVSDSTNFEI